MTNEKMIRSIVRTAANVYAEGFSTRHLLEVDNPNGVINMKIHNVFISSLGMDIQFYSALARSLDSSLGNLIERMAIEIARLHYEVKQEVSGTLTVAQTQAIATLLESYKRHEKKPAISDYAHLRTLTEDSTEMRRHDSDYYLFDTETNTHYLIELKIGGDLDNKKARSEKEALLEQYCLLSNRLGQNANIQLCFATAYNRYGEGKPWTQGRVKQFFAKEELLISADFWNLICKDPQGYNIVIDEYQKNASVIVEALNDIKNAYLND